MKTSQKTTVTLDYVSIGEVSGTIAFFEIPCMCENVSVVSRNDTVVIGDSEPVCSPFHAVKLVHFYAYPSFSTKIIRDFFSCILEGGDMEIFYSALVTLKMADPYSQGGRYLCNIGNEEFLVTKPKYLSLT